MSITLSIVVPCFNSAEYMGGSIDSLLIEGTDDVEVVIVNDGSSDATAGIADDYAARYPGRVRAVHKENGGHGSAINAGLAVARGTYFKVLDSDDWLDPEAYREALALLRTWVRRDEPVDLLITNFVYEKQGKKRCQSVNYKRALPRNRVLGWPDVRSFLPWQPMLMHSMIYRTELLRDFGLDVPENCFYVDNYVAFAPLPKVRTLYYLEVDLYRYFIGRSDQSVNEKVMLSRIDQQLRVNRILIQSLSDARQKGIPWRLDRYMVNYATMVSTVSSALLIRDGSDAALQVKADLWDEIRAIDADVYRDMRRLPLGLAVSSHGKAATATVRYGYHIAHRIFGFN